ncbi:erythroid differentiation-related factor 1-like [Impatiens glandulifera]|uniref:erythroid differentiation-related factor 1-like n=1 Tax=Impatiens glandulifera TaxID=253017 RepID=UPI001FB194E4|nr:erythroid differentiation-related factor 1-like [Impatiens glandulifera]
MMERPSSPSSSDLHCVGRLEIVKPEPFGFLTDKSLLAVNSALVPTAQTLSAPQYRVLPNGTDLNTPPIAAACSRTSEGDSSWENSAMTSSLTRKGEALAVSGLAEYGDEIDIIAPTEILKQIFKIPYSKARLSIEVRRIGQTLVLNTGYVL